MKVEVAGRTHTTAVIRRAEAMRRVCAMMQSLRRGRIGDAMSALDLSRSGEARDRGDGSPPR